MIGELFDSLIGIPFPSWGMRRTYARMAIRDLKAGELNRLNKKNMPRNRGVNPTATESQVSSARSRSMFWSDPRVSKAQRFIASRVIGVGMNPQSLAVHPDSGEAWPEFASLAEKLWERVRKELCYEGRPGKGGMTVDGMAVANFNEMFISGDGITRRIRLSAEEAKRDRRTLPLAYSLYSSNNLVDNGTALTPLGSGGNRVLRGIEYDDKGLRVAYHLYRFDPHDQLAVATGQQAVDRVPVDDIIHTYIQDYPGLIRGQSWVCPSVDGMAITDDLIDNEVQSSAAAACVMGVITRERPGSSFGLAAPTGASNTEDDGQAIERLQPAMLARLKTGEDFKGFNPGRNASDVDKTAGIALRSAAAGIRGMKASTLTQDYERGSFSSEVAADNDISFEHEMIQEHYAESWYQNVYEDVIRAGIGIGWFNSLKGRGTSDQFQLWLTANVALLLPATWQGPVQKWLQPASAENASQIAVGTGTSNVPFECAARGYRWRNVVDGQIAYWQYLIAAADKAGVPQELLSSLLANHSQPEGRPAVRAATQSLFGTNGAKHG